MMTPALALVTPETIEIAASRSAKLVPRVMLLFPYSPNWFAIVRPLACRACVKNSDKYRVFVRFCYGRRPCRLAARPPARQPPVLWAGQSGPWAGQSGRSARSLTARDGEPQDRQQRCAQQGE